MARLSSTNPSAAHVPSVTAIDLDRMLQRLQTRIRDPDISEPRAFFLREKFGTNLEHARTLLSQLEQDAQAIKVQSSRQQVQADLIQKREVILRLSERLEELHELDDFSLGEDDSDGEDILGQDTPSETTDDNSAHEPERTPSPPTNNPSPIINEPLAPPPPSIPDPISSQPPNELRARKAELFSKTPDAFTSSASTSAPMPTSTTEALMSHHRIEQEESTAQLLALAKQLKESSYATANAIEADKSVLENAVKGMDRNELGLESARGKMGQLRGSGGGGTNWFGLPGLIIMYIKIAGLAVLALVIVFVLPKLRF